MLERPQVIFLHVSSEHRPDRLIGIEHGDIAPLPFPGQRGAAVDEHRGQVESHHRHHHAGQRLVAAGESDERVIGMTARHRLDAVGDDLARHQGVAHAAVVHRHRVGHRDRGEIERHASRAADAGAGFARELAEQRIARRDAPAGRGDADERAADIYGRFIGAKLQDALGQPFVVEDRPGGGSIVGTDVVAKSPPDGYTLLMMSNTHTVNETLIPKKPFDLMRDFAPITPVNYSVLIMVIHPSVPAKDLKEFIALAKSKPGALNYASSGPGTPYHMAGELFKAMAGVDIVHVPHKGSDQARTAVLGGQVQMMFDAITTMAGNARAGKVHALGTTGNRRSPVMPETPTIAEAGVPGYEATIWLGLMAPAGTPPPVLDKLNAEIQRVTGVSEVKEAWAKQGAFPMHMTPTEFGKYVE